MELMRRSFGDLRRSLFALIVYEIVFSIILATALAPVAWWALTVLVSRTGRKAITNVDIIGFLLSPWGVVVVLSAGGVILATGLAQTAGVVIISGGSGGSVLARALAGLWKTAMLFPRLLRLGLLQFGLAFLVSIPFLVLIAVTKLVLLSGHDINFYLSTSPPRFWIAVAIAATLLLANGFVIAALYVRWSASVPLTIFEWCGAWVSLRTSARLVAGSFWRRFGLLAAWMTLMFLLIDALGWAVEWLATSLVLRSSDDLSWVLPIVAVYLALELALLTVGSFLWFNVHCILIRNLYLEACRRLAREVPETALPSVVAEADVTPTRSWPLMVGGTVLVLLVVTTFVAWGIAEDLEAAIDRDVEITAHRGSAKEAPENSISAIEQAIEDGADFAEIDVQETADGEIVLLHDVDLMRITGDPRRIWEVDYAGIKDLDAGSWFSPEFAGERIPTLVEAIAAARGKIKLNIELKFHGHEKRFVESFVEIIEDEGFEGHCVVTSLDYEGLMKTKGLNERLKVGLIVSATIGNMRSLPVDFLSLQSSLVNPSRVDRLHASGKRVVVWSLSEPDAMRRAIRFDVDNIITSYPRTAVAVLREFHDMGVAERLLLEIGDELLLD